MISRSWVAVLAFGMILVGCAPKYDAQTDKQISDLQLGVNEGMLGMITATKAYEAKPTDPKLTAAAGYSQNAKFYDDTDAKLAVLTTRVDQTPNLVDAAKAPLTGIEKIMQRTRTFHETRNVVPSPALSAARADLNSLVATLVGLMQVLKSGSSVTK